MRGRRRSEVSGAVRGAVALAIVCGGACASTATTAVAPTIAAPPATTATVAVDYRRLFGGRASSSIYDPRLVTPALMERVLLEPAALAEDDADKGIEAWTLRKLLQGLGQRGALVVAPPPPACDRPACYAAAPTAAIRNLRFVSGKNAVAVRVEAADGGYRVLLRFGVDEPSLCSPELSLKVRVVQLVGQLQKLPEGFVAAAFQELLVVEAPPRTTLEVRGPEPSADPGPLCAAIAAAWEDTPGFAADDARFEEAAREVIGGVLGPLFGAAR